MSPTVLRHRGYRLYFFSKEERRPHVHVSYQGKHAKFWIVPAVELATNSGLPRHRVTEVRNIVRSHRDEILAQWESHVSG